MAIYNEDELYWWKMGQVRSTRSAPKKAGGRTAGEIAIRTYGVAWYDFLDASLVTNDGGGLISSALDKLNSHTLTAAAGARPTLGATGLAFNGTSNYMKTANFTFNQPELVFLVIKQNTWTNGDYFTSGTTNLSGVIYQNASSSKLAIYAGGLVQYIEPPLGTYGIITALFSGANSFIQWNEGAPVTGNAGTTNMGGIVIGATYDGGSKWADIELKGAAYLSSATDATTRANIRAFLKSKYSI